MIFFVFLFSNSIEACIGGSVECPKERSQIVYRSGDRCVLWDSFFCFLRSHAEPEYRPFDDIAPLNIRIETLLELKFTFLTNQRMLLYPFKSVSLFVTSTETDFDGKLEVSFLRKLRWQG